MTDSIHDLVVKDIEDRKAFGLAKYYGQPLRIHDGRDTLVDVYQEALDLCCYLRKMIEEREPDCSDNYSAWLSHQGGRS